MAARRRALLCWLVALIVTAAVTACASATAGSVPASAPSATPSPAASPAADPPPLTATVGPLFTDGLSRQHSCTASVIASSTHDLIITAAHCLSDSAQGDLFAPGYAAGGTPYGVWTVQHAYVSAAWNAQHPPAEDFAVLQLARRRVGGDSVGIEQVTGANSVGAAPDNGEQILAIAYNGGLGDQPVRCSTKTYYSGGEPTFDCHGFRAGSSGSPWLTPATGGRGWAVRGLIGGRDEGGCQEYTSYSPLFTPAVTALVRRAERRDTPSTVVPDDAEIC